MSLGALLSAFALVAVRPQGLDPARMAVITESFDSRIASQNDVWFEAGEFPRCIQTLRIQHALHPDNLETMTDLGWMLENVERWDEALAVYVAFRKQYPNDPDAYFPEARFYYMKKAYSKVPPLLERSINMSTKPHPNNYRTLAQAYERMGLLADARRVYLALLAILPDDGATKRNLERVERKIKGADK